MKIISFNEAQQDSLLEKATLAHKKHRYREAYDFLREALKYGENILIFNRAASILNEMGEYEGTTQVTKYALKCDAKNSLAHWESAVACERLWHLHDAIQFLKQLPPDFPVESPQRREYLWGMCHLKLCNPTEVRRSLFRNAQKQDLPEPLHSRLCRLEECLSQKLGTSSSPPSDEKALSTNLTLTEWMWIMHEHRLLYPCAGSKGFSLHLFPDQKNAADFQGEHFVMGYPSFLDCGRMLLQLKRMIEKENQKYHGVYSCESESMGLTKAVSQILNLPVVESAKLAASHRLLLCLASNHGGNAAKISRRWPNRHDLFILAKTFEREEFYDLVAPPYQIPSVNTWSDPIVSEHHQIIGAIGEFISLPWESVSIKAYEANRDARKPEIDMEFQSSDPWNSDEVHRSQKITEKLLWGYEKACGENS